MTDFPGSKSRERNGNRLRLHRWPGRSRRRRDGGFAYREAGCGEEQMATALVDLYGGEDFKPFDRIILPEGYSPSADEEFMCGQHRAYFLRKLKAWKEAIIEESRQTMAQLQVDSLREPDIADRASSETDWGIAHRTRDRQRMLISTYVFAFRRLYVGVFGFCDVPVVPFSLGRLVGRPVALLRFK